MAKAEKGADKTAEKKEKKVRAPKEYNLPLHNRGNEDVRQTVQHVRGVGVFVTTVAIDSKGKATGAVSTVWIAGLKPKSKNGERFLVQDKGPKPKKAKTEKTAKAKDKK